MSGCSPAATGALGAIAADLAARPRRWRHAVRFAPSRVHTRVAWTPDWEAWLLTWLPGQRTEVHDHGGSAGGIAVVCGVLCESVPALGADGCLRWQENRLEPGPPRELPADHVHAIENTTHAPAISLHVYGPRLHTMSRYERTAGGLRVVGVDRAGVDW